MASAPNFQRGNTPRPGDRISSKDFAGLANAITGARQAPRTDVFGVQAAGGFIPFPAANQPSPRTVATFPFQVITQADPSNPTTKRQASVFWNSSLLINQIANNVQIIAGGTMGSVNTLNGLADAPSPIGDGNPNWFELNYDTGPVANNEFIWLEIMFTSGASAGVTGAGINCYGAGGLWQPGDNPDEYGIGRGPFEYQLTYDSLSNKIYTQYVARIQIWQSLRSGSSGSYTYQDNQLLFDNLALEGDIYPDGPLENPSGGDGPAIIPIVMPKPFAAPWITL